MPGALPQAVLRRAPAPGEPAIRGEASSPRCRPRLRRQVAQGPQGGPRRGTALPHLPGGRAVDPGRRCRPHRALEARRGALRPRKPAAGVSPLPRGKDGQRADRWPLRTWLWVRLTAGDLPPGVGSVNPLYVVVYTSCAAMHTRPQVSAGGGVGTHGPARRPHSHQIPPMNDPRGRGDTGDTPAVQAGEGGSTPTRPLHSLPGDRSR